MGFRRQRVLVVGMPDSVHLANWLSQFESSGLIFRIVPSSPLRRVHSKLQDLLTRPEFSLSRLGRVLALPLWLLDRALSDWSRGLLLAYEARLFRPDLIHINEFQNAGYMYLRARTLSQTLRNTKVVLTPYGSDMYWFARYRWHRAKIIKLLKHAWGLSSECKRDENIAQKLGFEGTLLPRIPAFGQLQVDPIGQHRIPRENLIVIKGYQNKWGRALNALWAVYSCRQSLRGFSVALYSCNWPTLIAAEVFSRASGIRATAFGKGKLSQAELAEYFARALVYIGLSRSDGISASMIEAMANGAIPIQSSTSCCEEWIDDGIGGFLVDYFDKRTISQRLLRIVEDTDFQALARKSNFEKLSQSLDSGQIRQAAMETYLLPLNAESGGE